MKTLKILLSVMWEVKIENKHKRLNMSTYEFLSGSKVYFALNNDSNLKIQTVEQSLADWNTKEKDHLLTRSVKKTTQDSMFLDQGLNSHLGHQMRWHLQNMTLGVHLPILAL